MRRGFDGVRIVSGESDGLGGNLRGGFGTDVFNWLAHLLHLLAFSQLGAPKASVTPRSLPSLMLRSKLDDWMPHGGCLPFQQFFRQLLGSFS
jgi:hypothetical protein